MILWSSNFYCSEAFSLTTLNRVDGYRARGVLTKVLHHEAQPRDPTPYPFIYQFWAKRCPFRIPSIDKWYPFHIPGLELCILNCCKCTVFEKWIHHKTRTHLVNIPLIVGLFTDGNAIFPYPFIYTSTSEITTPFYTVKPRFTPHCYGRQFALSLGKRKPLHFLLIQPT